MARLITILVLMAIVYYTIKSMFKPALGPSARKDIPDPEARADEAEMVKDPQCGTYVERQDAVRLDYKGKTLYFCSEECAEKHRSGNGD